MCYDFLVFDITFTHNGDGPLKDVDITSGSTKWANFLNSWGNNNFSGRTMVHRVSQVRLKVYMQLLTLILDSAKVSWTPASKLTGLPFPLEARIFLFVIAVSEGDRRVNLTAITKVKYVRSFTSTCNTSLRCTYSWGAVKMLNLLN